MSGEDTDSNRKQWWIYKGEKGLDEIKDDIPSWRDKSKTRDNAKAYIPLNDEIIDAVNAVIYLRRPLLVTGDPGIGKSSLARSIKEDLGLKEVLHWQITSKSTLKEGLYSYDSLSRLHDMQMKKIDNDLRGNKKRARPYDDSSTQIDHYLRLRALGSAFVSEERRVVLIDEIDKSDIDFPNDLLHVFEEQEFEIPELQRMKRSVVEIKDADGTARKIEKGKVVCKQFPIIVMTSNDEREFSPAFLRRCISIRLELPKDDKEKVRFLQKMVEAHLDDMASDERSAITKVVERFVALKKSPGLRSNDQLLNAAYMILRKDMMDQDTFAQELEQTLFKALE